MSVLDKIFDKLEALYQKGQLDVLPEHIGDVFIAEGKREAIYEASRKAMGISLDTPIVVVECSCARDVDCERCGREVGLPMRQVVVRLGNIAGAFCAGYDERERVVKVTRVRFLPPPRYR